MKRKIFSKLLMGALLIASVSSFVSCKDYDDDIDNLQKQIDAAALKAELTNLQSTLATQIAAAQAAADKAAQAAAAAQKTADAAATAAALDAVKEAATKAGTDAAKALTDAANAQTAADAAKAAAEAAKYDDTAVTAAAAKAQSTADNAVAAAGKAQEAADAAQKAADEAKAAAAAAKYDDAALKAAVEKAQKAADAAAAAAEAAQKKADAAQAKADAAAADAASKATAKDIEDAIAKATEAINAATEAKIAAAVAKAVADLTAKIPADQSDAIADLTSRLNTLAANQASVATAEALQTAVTELEGKIAAAAAASGDAAAAAAAISEASAAIGTLKTAINEIYSMVTSVELIGTWAGNIVPNAMRLNGNYDISFIHGKMVTSESFGNNEDQFFQFADADQVKYTEGADIRTDKNLLIRVNPTNATFTTEQIQLVDSKGNDLSNFIEITEVARYTNLITRSVDNTGLWTVKIKVKDGADKAAFNRYVYNGGELNANNEIAGGRQIVYAVAINNTKGEDISNRYVASTYDLRTRWTNYVPANRFDLDFVVSPTNQGRLFNMANRWGNIWNNNTGVAEDGILGENGRDRIFTNPELTWQVPAAPAAIPTDANTVAAGNALTADPNLLVAAWPFNDRRLNWGFIEVDPGQTLTLSNIDGYAVRYGYDARTKSYYWDTNTTIEYYYVTLDLGNSVESAPSEFNAWKSYKIGGLNTMTKGSESLDLVFDDPTLVGDYIGFRVYAVNYDGTLVDPDGRAFYVHVKGDVPEVAAVNVTITANTRNANFTTPVTWNQNVGKENVTQSYETLVNYGGRGITWTGAFQGYKDFYVSNSATLYEVLDYNPGGYVRVRTYFQLLDKNNNVVGNWKDIKSVRVTIDNPGYIQDGTQYGPIYIYGTSQNTSGTPVLNELNIFVTKAMPTQAAATPVWRASLEPDATGLLTVYPWPTNNTGALGAGGITWYSAPGGVNRIGKDLTLYVNNKEQFRDWTVNANAGVGNTPIILNGIAGDDLNGDGVNDNEPSAWTFISNSNKIGKTYDSHIEYVYPNLSTYWNEATNSFVYSQDYIVNTWTATQTSGKIQYANAMDLFSYGLAQYTYSDDATKKGTALYIKWSEVDDPGVDIIHNFWGLSNTAGAYATRVPAAGDVTLAQLLTNTTSDTNKRIATNAGIVADLDLAGAANATEIALYPGCTVSPATRLTNAIFDPLLYPGGITATVTGDVTTLITITYNVYGADKFEIQRYVNPTTGAYGDVPTADKQGNIVVKGKDVFNKEHTIATIPFTLLYNK